MPHDTAHEINIIRDTETINEILSTLNLSENDVLSVSSVVLIAKDTTFTDLWVSRYHDHNDRTTEIFEKIYEKNSIIPNELRRRHDLNAIWGELAIIEGVPLEASSPI
jgi:hypothetical protein